MCLAVVVVNKDESSCRSSGLAVDLVYLSGQQTVSSGWPWEAWVHCEQTALKKKKNHKDNLGNFAKMFRYKQWSVTRRNPLCFHLFGFWKCLFLGTRRREKIGNRPSHPWRADLSTKSIRVQRMRRHITTTVLHCGVRQTHRDRRRCWAWLWASGISVATTLARLLSGFLHCRAEMLTF